MGWVGRFPNNTRLDTEDRLQIYFPLIANLLVCLFTSAGRGLHLKIRDFQEINHPMCTAHLDWAARALGIFLFGSPLYKDSRTMSTLKLRSLPPHPYRDEVSRREDFYEGFMKTHLLLISEHVIYSAYSSNPFA
jgi:hypothetical protein